MSNTRRYVYGVIEAEPLELEVEGVEGADRVTTVQYRDHAAVVSDAESRDPERTDENVQAHNEVLRTVMDHGDGRTVVPMRFGMVFENDRALKNVLRNGRRAFERALREAEGTIELGVKVIAPADGGIDRSELTDAVEETLGPASERSIENEQFSDRLVVNRSYLVERSDREAFDRSIDELRAAHDDAKIQYTGPWPPYSFVDIQIGVEQ